MAAPVIPLQVIQAGRQSTAGPGNAVAATARVDFTPGTGTLKREIKKQIIRNSGSFATAHRSQVVSETVQVDWSFPVSYDRLVTYFGAAVAPLTTGTGNPNALWSYPAPSDTADNLHFYTLEVGGVDTTNPWPLEFRVTDAHITDFEIDIKHSDVWQGKVTWLGIETDVAAKTSALSLPSNALGGVTPLQEVRTADTKVYIDSTTIGTTQITGTILSAKVKVTNGYTSRFTLDATQQANRIARSKERMVSADIVYEYNASTEYTAWASNTPRKIRIKSAPAAIGGVSYVAQIDLYGIWNAHTLAADGDVIVEQLTLSGQYDAGATTDINVSVTNSISALP